MFRFSAVAVVAVCVALSACTNTKESTTTPPPPATTMPVTGDRFQVTGTATSVSAERALTDAIPPPFTITVAERGVGGAEIDHALVAGKLVQINWNAGQPLPLRGGPALNLNIAAVRIDGKGITWSLDGAARDFLPGMYTLAAPIAVGGGGLATPMDNVSFTADAETTLSTRGNAIVVLPAAKVRIEGRDGAVILTGQLVLATPTDERKVSSVRFGPGNYEVTLTPTGGRYSIVAKLEGGVTAR